MGKSACRATRALDLNFVDSEDTKNFNRHFKMSSGVAVDDECKNVFEEIKKNKKHRYIVFYIKDEKSIAVETIGGRDASYDSFLTDLMKNGESECRYGLTIWSTNINVREQQKSAKKQKLFLM